MNRCFSLYFSVFILTWVLLPACATQRTVTLPDGSKVLPSPTYVSAKEMTERGKNSYGVPATSFAFYPSGWTAPEKNEAGRTKEEHIEYAKALLKAKGESAEHIPYCPGGTPAWDRSCADPPDIRHDCFSVERLFVVPWGTGETDIGIRRPLTENALMRSGAVASTVGGLGSDVVVQTSSWARRYRWNGDLLDSRHPILNMIEWPQKYERYCERQYGSSLPAVGYNFSAGGGQALAYYEGQKPFCKVYMPHEEHAWDVSMLADCSGFIFTSTTDSGIEIHFYRAR